MFFNSNSDAYMHAIYVWPVHSRLLRNRVSAQQARERKKVYVNDLESRANELQDSNSKLEEKISTLINENAMLRKVSSQTTVTHLYSVYICYTLSNIDG